MRATDDSADGLGAILRDANLAPVDGLAVRLRLGREFEDLTHDDRAGQFTAVDGFFLEPDGDECLVQVVRGDGLGQVDPFRKLAGGNTHD